LPGNFLNLHGKLGLAGGKNKDVGVAAVSGVALRPEVVNGHRRAAETAGRGVPAAASRGFDTGY
jgi:hypothetical protein